MTFVRTDLALDGSGQNTTMPRRFSYTTIDTDTVVSTSGYFNNAADLLNPGDVINIATSTGGTALHGRVLVLTNTGTVVDVADIEVFLATDTE